MQENPVTHYLNKLSPGNGRRSIESQLKKVARLLGYDDYLEFPWNSLRLMDVVSIQNSLLENGQSSRTIKLVLAALRGVLLSAFELGQYQAEDLLRIKRVKGPSGPKIAPGRLLDQKEQKALNNSCILSSGAAEIRDAAILALMLRAGLNRAEIAGLQVTSPRICAEGFFLTVIGKKKIPREIPLNEETARHLHRWMEIRGKVPGPLFLPIKLNGKLTVQDHPMSPQAIYYIFKRRAQAAGLKNCSPSDARRTFANDVFDNEAESLARRLLVGPYSLQD